MRNGVLRRRDFSAPIVLVLVRQPNLIGARKTFSGVSRPTHMRHCPKRSESNLSIDLFSNVNADRSRSRLFVVDQYPTGVFLPGFLACLVGKNTLSAMTAFDMSNVPRSLFCMDESGLI